jgi:hypothetical protein
MTEHVTSKEQRSDRRAYPPKHSPEVSAIVSELIKVAAELARGIADEPVIPDTAARYVRERAAKAVDDANERAKVIALRIRHVVNKLPSTAHEPPAAREPDGYAYRYQSTWNPKATFISFEERNQSAIESIPYWLGTPPTSAPPPGREPPHCPTCACDVCTCPNSDTVDREHCPVHRSRPTKEEGQ